MQNSVTEWNLAEVRRLVKDHFVYKPFIYWSDFLLSIALFWSSVYLALHSTLFSSCYFICLLLGALSGYRSVLFIHEISHFKSNSVPNFTLVWNLLCGIPLFAPSFMYRGVHNDHHSKLFYGTKNDGEYVPFGADSPSRILLYLLTTIISPILLPLRFTILAFVSFFIPPFRQIVVSQLSSFVIDFEYIRAAPDAKELRDWRWQEALCFIWGCALIFFVYIKVLPLSFFLHFYLVCCGIFILNSIRTIAAHRYRNRGEPISMQEQVLDSVNIVGTPLITTFLCPVGLRYHALHHLFPTMPYHSLADAHKILMREIPQDSFYRQTNERNILTAIRTLWRDAKNSQSKQIKDKISLVPQFLRKKTNEIREAPLN